ncbi:MAG: hypothetical protein Q7R55_00390 [Candidatus Wildermuthbacteria bacterium]|nr:hypothetical protein [Candidatus Wildermuthbacteria bacterium]
MTRSKKILIASLAALLGTFLFVLFIISPLLSGVVKTTELLKAEKLKRLELETQIVALEDFQRFAKANEENFKKFDTLFLKEQNPSPFFNFLESQALREGLSLKIVPQEPKKLPEDRWTGIDFQASSRTSFPKLFAFLERIEQSPYLLEIKNVQIAKKEGETDFSLFFKAYSK